MIAYNQSKQLLKSLEELIVYTVLLISLKLNQKTR